MSSPVIESPTVDEASSSPRSTVLSTSHEACTSKDRHMTTDVATMNEASVTGGTTGAEAKVTSPKEASDTIDGTNGNTNPTPKDSNKGVSATKESGSPIPVPQAAASLPGYPSQLTPQPMSAGYYQGYGHHMTPEPPSPGGNHPVVTARAYETGSFFQQHGAFNAPQNSPFGGPNTPLSPPRGTNQTMGGPIPPASPLFPRVNNGSAGLEGPPASPNLPYMSSGMYQQSYPIVNHANSGSSGSQDEANGWGDRNQQNVYQQNAYQQNAYQQNSPHINAYGMPMTRAGAGGRAYSFEESMLPPSASMEDPGNPAYSPYGGSQGSPGGGTLFALPQPWGYGGPPPDMYNPPGSPLQPRATAHPGMVMPYPGMSGGAGGGAGMRGPPGAYGQYFPASSPGPPIQTTASNKGPDGANLFIFHIPNHFTNIDMYQLFCAYGNLLSVRIMVERDTGRSRGFGFVSYDAPESAALAIKELNGFSIGNKRLKVQHKQIRHKGMDNDSGSFAAGNDQRPPFSSSLPPSGPMAAATAQNLWYGDPDSGNPDGAPDGTSGKPDEGTEQTSTSTVGAETPLGLDANDHASAPDSISPLANLGTLQNALSEVASAAGTTE